jgi:hypothetical protein
MSKVGDVPFRIDFVDEGEIIKTKAFKHKLIVNSYCNLKKV